MSTLLPAGFAALTPFTDCWAISGSIARAARRGDAHPTDRAAFFAAAAPLLDAALTHLDTCPINALSPADQRLMDMMLTLAHVSLTEEILGDQEPAHYRQRRAMHITRTPAGA
ncbi:hypothetical protein PMI04_006265 [Sphingobium sp. AP49]|uniref:hypothetical protein n=1 Tax=Sphingobium sp. AP49 TaxID=1144307 RepID=UPI00026EE543|nr:hypothetical protein [Sphingobium sp. AP49]WHO40193.1 hypothetical protein PMI04_006265 [Sphingobium sp. AP49]